MPTSQADRLVEPDVELLAPGSPVWIAALDDVPHDVYHLPQYVRLAASHEGGEPYAAHLEDAGGRFLMPLLLKEVPGSAELLGRTAYDAISPYGYPGPVMACDRPGREEETALRGLESLTAALRGCGVVSLFLRLHPIIDFPTAALERLGRVVDHGHTVALDVRKDDETLVSEFRKGHRRSYRKARAQTYEFHVADGTELLDEFIDIYTENMDRVEAAPFYYFSRDYLEGLLLDMPGKVHIAMLTVNGEPACVDLLTEVGGIVQAHLGATRARFLDLTPSVLLAHYECGWARERGNRLLHLGGGLGGGEDSLFFFKAGLSPLRFPFRTFRAVTDADRFEVLLDDWSARTGNSADDYLSARFPPYRPASAG